MPYVTVGKENGANIDIYYKDWGTGQPIVFSHGWPLSADDWDAQMLFFLSLTDWPGFSPSAAERASRNSVLFFVGFPIALLLARAYDVKKQDSRTQSKMEVFAMVIACRKLSDHCRGSSSFFCRESPQKTFSEMSCPKIGR
jgi:hypothetical protein